MRAAGNGRPTSVSASGKLLRAAILAAASRGCAALNHAILSERSGHSKRTVQTSVATLRSRSLIETQRRAPARRPALTWVRRLRGRCEARADALNAGSGFRQELVVVAPLAASLPTPRRRFGLRGGASRRRPLRRAHSRSPAAFGLEGGLAFHRLGQLLRRCPVVVTHAVIDGGGRAKGPAPGFQRFAPAADLRVAAEIRGPLADARRCSGAPPYRRKQHTPPPSM